MFSWTTSEVIQFYFSNQVRQIPTDAEEHMAGCETQYIVI